MVRKRNPPRRGAPADQVAARELVLFGENEGTLYERQVIPIVKNLARKMAAGIYDHEKAKVLWGYYADNTAKEYQRQYGSSEGLIFSPATRRLAAAAFADAYLDHVKDEAKAIAAARNRNPPGEVPPGVDGCSRCGAIPGQRRLDGSISGRLVAGLCGDCRAELGEKRTGQAGLFQNPRRHQAKKNPPLWSWDGHGINYDGRRVFTMNPDLRGRKGFSYIATHIERALNYLNYPLDVSGNGA